MQMSLSAFRAMAACDATSCVRVGRVLHSEEAVAHPGFPAHSAGSGTQDACAELGQRLLYRAVTVLHVFV